MYYFVPAWYGTDRIWQQTATPWYWMRESIEFDDTINQVRIFQEAGMDRILLLPHYSPQLRYFLHRQDLLETDVLSIFDRIQKVPSDLAMRPVQLQDIEWPSETTFSYTPFLAIAFRKGKRLAKIDMGVDGNILTLTRYKEGETLYVEYLDDRGFISSRVYYKDEKPYFQEYLSFDGQWILREMLIEENQSVMVNEAFFPAFKKESYSNMGEVVAEKMKEQLLTLVPGRDQLVVAAHPANLTFLQDTASRVKKVLSFYGDRQPLSAENFALYFDMIDAQLLITDSEKTKEAIAVFSLAWLKRRTGLPLLTPVSVWVLVRSARNQRFTIMSMKASFQARNSLKIF
ncbi:accessory Sec system protein Asp1 [Streptococcus lactarius]|uniref:accessory Sec system protein Asp1 n=1 Tax=Streptococcus lactarius TaxID=684066 RepID=UPI00360918EF